MNYPNCHGLEGLQTCTDAYMPPCQTSTFTSDGVNIIKQPERITLEPTKMANVPAEYKILPTKPLLDEVINKPSIFTNDTRSAIS
jgi:hypothetical protein